MPADAPVTILSSGKAGSVLRAHVDLAVPLVEAAEEGAASEGGEGAAAAGASKNEEASTKELEAAAAALFDTMRTSDFSFGEEDKECHVDDDDAMDADGGAAEKKEKKEKKKAGAPKWLEEKLLEARRRGTVASAASAAASAASAGASASPAPTSEADLHLALTLARLYALSHGETVLRKGHWEGVERLEAERRARLSRADLKRWVSTRILLSAAWRAKSQKARERNQEREREREAREQEEGSGLKKRIAKEGKLGSRGRKKKDVDHHPSPPLRRQGVRFRVPCSRQDAVQTRLWDSPVTEAMRALRGGGKEGGEWGEIDGEKIEGRGERAATLLLALCFLWFGRRLELEREEDLDEIAGPFAPSSRARALSLCRGWVRSGHALELEGGSHGWKGWKG